jgi:hypothetical protein
MKRHLLQISQPALWRTTWHRLLRNRQRPYNVISRNETSVHGRVFIEMLIIHQNRFQWPSGLRRGSAAARLLGLRVRIPPWAWVFVVSVVCCQVEVSAMGWSLVQRSPTDCVVSLCVISKPQEWGG